MIKMPESTEFRVFPPVRDVHSLHQRREKWARVTWSRAKAGDRESKALGKYLL
jgi:hypothetical protein